MSDGKKTWPWSTPPQPAPAAPVGQRRASRVVHDERGNARIEWIEESADRLLDDRVPLEIVEDGPDLRGATVWNPRQVEKGWDPYQSVSNPQRGAAREAGVSAKKDLRKLSEWIKLKREMDARRLRADDEPEES